MEETLGKRIMRHRKNLGLTQEQLAEQLGVTAQAVSKWENDLSCPDITMLPKLTKIFGTTADALLGSAPERTEETVFSGEVVEENEPEGIHLEKGGWEFHWDGGRRGYLSCAVLVLAVGLQLLAARLLDIEIGFWQILWPSSLICFGIGGLFGHFSFIKIGSVLLGGWFLADYWDLLPVQLGSGLVFPALVIVFGLSLLVEAIKKPRRSSFRFHHKGNHQKQNDFQQQGDTFTYSACFGESSQRPVMAVLRSGEISCSFGEYTVDLTQVAEIAEDCTLEANCAFGELTLRIPKCYALHQDNSTFLAGFDISGHPDPNPRGTIRLEANASFGEIDVQYV